MKNQAGYFALITIALIVIVGFLGTAVVYMFVGSATSNINFSQSAKAFYIADGGLEKATRYLSTPLLSGTPARIGCGSVTSNANLTNSSLGDGTFTVTGTLTHVNTPTTLNGAVTSSSTTITVASTTGYQNSGRILVDREAINYASTDATHFYGAIRGADSTTAVSHVTATPVSQYQCDLSSSGGIPNLTSPTNKRITEENIELQEGWTTGNNGGGQYTFGRWNYPTELTWNNGGTTGAFNLNGVSIISNLDVWAVGANQNFLHWNGSAWSTSNSTVNTTYTRIYCPAFNNCHAVGNSQGSLQVLVDWNGSAWSRASPSGSTGNINLSAIHCATNSDCWAVGNRSGATKIFYRWNGSTWTGVSVTGLANASFPFMGVSCTATNNCWAVGANNAFAFYNGTWSALTFASLPSVQYRDLYCNNANDCWAVGTTSGGDVMVHYDGSTWTRDASRPTPATTMRGVTCANSDDCWAVGSSSSGGVIHYDGTSWTAIATSMPTGRQLNAVDLVHANSKPVSGWSENFP